MRALAALLVLIALQFTPGVASAQSYPTREAAFNACMSSASTLSGTQYNYACQPTSSGTILAYRSSQIDYCPNLRKQYISFTQGQSCASGSGAGPMTWPSATPCPAGSTWDEPSKKCFNGAACLAHNAEDGFKNVGPVSRTFTERCVGGCQYQVQSPYSMTTAGSGSLVVGEFMFTGAACGAAVPLMPVEEVQAPPPQTCIPLGGDQSVCLKNNGEHCYSGPVGRPMQFCWRPGEVGQKTSADVAQVRASGTTPAAATPPPGETMNASGASMGSVSALASGVSVTTVVQNYTTASGVEAGQVDQAEPLDGSGPASDSDKGSVTGGGDCDTMPVVTGDPVLANVVLQTWSTRCAVESGNAVHSTGEIGDCDSPFTVDGPADDANVQKIKGMRAAICGTGSGGSVRSTGEIANCTSPFTVSGPVNDPNVQKLRGLRATICGDDSDGNGLSDGVENAYPTLAEGMATGDTNPDGSGGVVASQAFGAAVEGDTANLDWGGWGYTRTCPVIPPITIGEGAGEVVVYDTSDLCELMQTFGFLMLLLSSLFAAKVMAGGIS